MTLWMVRAGKHGEREDLALNRNLLVIGWSDLPDLSQVRSRDALLSLCLETYPNDKRATVTNWTNQIWSFVGRMKTGDLVCLPLKGRAVIAVGRVAGPYQYRADLPPDDRHTRPVEWLNPDLPRSAFGQDLLYSLGAFLTVCQIRRNNAEARVRAILQTGRDPAVGPSPVSLTEGDDGDEVAATDLEAYARDQIAEYVGTRYKGHELTRLVAALLEAQGYKTLISPEGPDGGVDIIAGQGPMGFDPPRLCVQVKSSDQPLDVRPFRELQGVLHTFGAEQGLLVSWGGFKSSVHGEARSKFFQIRLWDAGDLVEALLAHYERLPEEVQAELPLKRIWTLVPEE
jgi:restriction system protein